MVEVVLRHHLLEVVEVEHAAGPGVVMQLDVGLEISPRQIRFRQALEALAALLLFASLYVEVD